MESFVLLYEKNYKNPVFCTLLELVENGFSVLYYKKINLLNSYRNLDFYKVKHHSHKLYSLVDCGINHLIVVFE